MLGIVDKDPNLIKGRQQIADYLEIHIQTFDKLRKFDNPPPVYKPFNEIEAYKSELKEWRKSK